MFEDDVPFPQVGYVSSLEGIIILWKHTELTIWEVKMLFAEIYASGAYNGCGTRRFWRYFEKRSLKVFLTPIICFGLDSSNLEPATVGLYNCGQNPAAV